MASLSPAKEKSAFDRLQEIRISNDDECYISPKKSSLILYHRSKLGNRNFNLHVEDLTTKEVKQFVENLFRGHQKAKFAANDLMSLTFNRVENLNQTTVVTLQLQFATPTGLEDFTEFYLPLILDIPSVIKYSYYSRSSPISACMHFSLENPIHQGYLFITYSIATNQNNQNVLYKTIDKTLFQVLNQRFFQIWRNPMPLCTSREINRYIFLAVTLPSSHPICSNSIIPQLFINRSYCGSLRAPEFLDPLPKATKAPALANKQNTQQTPPPCLNEEKKFN